MGEIKCKAFDRKTGDMFPVHEMQWNDKGELIFFKGRYDYEKDLYTVGGGNPNKMTGTANHKDGLVKRFEIIQYTGLKDKNGKEIYEGDILELYIPNWADCDDVQRFVINEYCPDVSYLQAVVKHCEECLLDGENDYIEVIGNIYENPELLGDSE